MPSINLGHTHTHTYTDDIDKVHHKKWYVLIMPVLKKLKQINLWNVLASQSSLLGRYQARKDHEFRKIQHLRNDTQGLPLDSQSTHIYEPTCGL